MGEEKYYVVQEVMHPDLRETATLHGLAFLTVADGEISHEAGDIIITEMTEFVDGNLKIKDKSLCTYEISPVSYWQYFLHKSVYESKLRVEADSRKPHSRILNLF